MANNMLDAEERVHLDYLFRTTPFLVLYTTLPAEDGTGGVEVSTSGTGYARQALSGKMGAATTASGVSTVANNAAVTFAEATANYGTVVGIGVADASTGGVTRIAVPLAASKTINSGITPTFAIGDLLYSIE